MANRHVCVILTLSLALSASLPACSDATRHRVLTFFFDGVPKRGQPAATPEAPAGPQAEAGSSGERAARSWTIHAHPPYRANRCRDCHDLNTGQLTRSVRDGLCASCHAQTVGQAAYVHGPVAVNDCVICHHHHASPYPKVLLEDARTICLRCHERAALNAASHAALGDDQVCIECHDPHGGANRFFLKHSER